MDYTQEYVLIEFTHIKERHTYAERLLIEHAYIKWMKENNIDSDWAIVSGRRIGVYMNTQDALVFKLTFGL